ncbi:type II secretion system protein [Bacillus timonensis]|uniref:Type II secretion system protein n=1 Tax=Bacillus timonensis TaxID=1033734 RepID=A0A4S3Q0H2_9BACI|nr:type II secretion system protein [Bacillus timonensis]THE15484.1 type II secretion system protein [Bacillus timonensis]
MLVKDKRGFTMVEMLLSVSIWLMLCVTLLPQLMFIMTERRNTEIFNIGTQLLSEELQKGYNGESAINHLVKYGVTYKFTKNYNETFQKSELCVTWEDKLSRTYERCGFLNGE